MLSSVLNLAAKPLEHSLRAYQRRDPNNAQIEPLLRTLKDSLPLSRRTGGAEHNEVESWSGTASGGLTMSIKHTMNGFVQWSLQPASVNVMPTSYTHRQMLCGLQMLGASRMLRIILDEVQQQSEAGNASIVYDVATALICAPDVSNDPPPPPNVQTLDESGNVPPVPQRQLSLREALKAEAENFRKLHKKDPALAEIVVRLHRKVEAQMTPSQAQILQADLGASMDTSDAVHQAAANAAAAAAVAATGAGDPMQMDSVGLDMMAGVTGSDFGMGGSGNGGSLDLSEDIFGLDSGMDTFDMWGDMMETS